VELTTEIVISWLAVLPRAVQVVESWLLLPVPAVFREVREVEGTFWVWEDLLGWVVLVDRVVVGRENLLVP